MGEQSRTHRERSQPAHRSKYGLLEKKKDYKLRSKNYHEKEDMIKNLEKKAVTRNPNEFYFKMTSLQKNSKGKILSQDHTLTPELVKLMKTQDRTYIAYLIQREQIQIEKYKRNCNLQWTGSKTVFHDGIPTVISNSDSNESEITQRQERLEQLKTVYTKMSLEYKLSHSKGARTKIENDDGTVVFKWSNQRAK